MMKYGMILISVFILSYCLAVTTTAQVDSEPGIKTDRRVYPPPPAPELPKAGGTFIDPTFGTTIMRVTDEADGKKNVHAYSYWPSFNLSNTFFHILTDADHHGKPTLYKFDPKEFKILGKEPLFPEKPPGDFMPEWEDCIWSGADANLIYCRTKTKIWQYDVIKKEYTLVRDLAKDLPEKTSLFQMSKSLNNNVFAFSVDSNPGNHIGYLIWQRDTDKVLLKTEVRKGYHLDEVQLDKSGLYCVIINTTSQQGKTMLETPILDIRNGKAENLTRDLALSHYSNGNGCVIAGDDYAENRIAFRKMTTPRHLTTVLALKNDWSQSNHPSMLADNEDWVLISFYVSNDSKSSGVFQDEIIQVSTDGYQKVRRLAHHRSNYMAEKDYWDQPRANISRDGKFVVCTSNWDGKGQRDVFILKVPPIRTSAGL
jgi:hypothetical protein